MKISRKDGSILDVAFEEEVGRDAFHHTTAHILAQAVKRLYPGTKCAIGPDGEKHRPIMLLRVVLGSLERFMGILIEHYAGKFPLWLSPVQVKILPISDRFLDYAKTIEASLKTVGLRCEMDARPEKIGYKIREARLQRVPYMVIVGEKEVESDMVSVRKRDQGEIGMMTAGELVEMLREEGI